MNRVIVSLECGVCRNRNYSTTRNKRTHAEKYKIKKYCPACRRHTEHKESK
ncbi:MAG: 50S ribosomal protein L33 [Myxococcales bacterium]|jgi:large subunit ribosomal protein L33|nr:50S ribosomal protein L33 [Myxococcales bacterium]